MAGAGVGFLLLDSSLRPLYANSEAVQILSYPDDPRKIEPLNTFIRERISTFLNGDLSRHNHLVKEFVSGKRRYCCRLFVLDGQPRDAKEPAVALLIERGTPEVFSYQRVAEHFHLTPRELQTVELLVRGLTSKEIADRMRISPNTVKAFIRLIMVKMRSTTRTGVIGRILEVNMHAHADDGGEDPFLSSLE